MALEINEVGIRLRVSDGGDGEEEERPSAEPGGGCELAREEIVADCVRRVLKILHRREER